MTEPSKRAERVRSELDPSGTSVLFCNGPQCPQTPESLHAPVEAGYPASSLAYYRGGKPFWSSTVRCGATFAGLAVELQRHRWQGRVCAAQVRACLRAQRQKGPTPPRMRALLLDARVRG